MRIRNRYLDTVVRIPLEVILLIVPLFLIKKFLLKPALALLPLSETAAHTIQGLVTLLMILGAYILIVKLLENRAATELSPVKAGLEISLGLAAGFGLMSAILGTLWLLGVYSAASPTLTMQLIESIVWLFSLAPLEEVLFRGIAYRIVEQNLGTVAALVTSAAIFGGMHITNENADMTSVPSATLGGLFVGLFFTLTGRLWLPIFFHYAWNLSQIFWGTPLSGMGEFGRFFVGRLEGPAWLTGGAFGPENSVITLAACTTLLVGCFRLAQKRGLIVPFRREAASASDVPPAVPANDAAAIEAEGG